MDFGLAIVDCRLWIADCGLWILDFRSWIQERRIATVRERASRSMVSKGSNKTADA